MYTEYWGLRLKPFQNTPDPRFLFASEQHEEALSRLLYAIEEEKPALLLTGTFGCGKTLLLQTLLARLDAGLYQTVFVGQPKLSPVEMIRAIARGLGAAGLPQKLNEMSLDYFHEVLEGILMDNTRDGRRNLVIIDEAHAIDNPDVFEELRLLLNYQHQDKPLLTLILTGQTELRDRIRANKQLMQRIPMSFQIEALKQVEVNLYVASRLKTAGTNRAIFSPAALESIARNSGGIPRRINQICDFCLTIGAHARVQEIDEDVVEDAVRTSGGLT